MRTRTRLLAAASVLALIVFPNSLHAQFGALGDALGSVVNTGVKIVTAPTRTVINAGRAVTGSGSPGEIFQPYREVASSAGRSIQLTTQAVTDPQRYLYNTAQSLAKEVGGDPALFILDLHTVQTRYANELAQAGVNNVGGILQGQNALQVVAAPLAAALRAARDRHSVRARPLPNDVKVALRGVFSEATLNRARYTVGRVEITLPVFIAQGQQFMGEEQDAVVVDHIIVFPYPPKSFAENAFWWTHEIMHVEQYKRWGIEKFAYRYVKDLGRSIESEADQKAVAHTRNRANAGQAYLQGHSFDMSSQASSAPSGSRASAEYYVAQAIFPMDRFGVHYLITNHNRIIAVDPISGRWLHIGFAAEPMLPGVAWTYWTPNLRYAVMPDGRILTAQTVFDPWGRPIRDNWIQVGHTILLR